MNEFDKALRWFDRVQTDVSEVGERFSTIAGKVASNSYDTKDALADWIYFVSKGCFYWLPDPGPGDIPFVNVKYSLAADGANNVIAMRRLPLGTPAGAPSIPAGLQDGANVLPPAKYDIVRINQDRDLLVTGKNLNAQGQGNYKGKAQIAGKDVATVAIKVDP